jgi:hypothetical protein
MMLWDFPLLSLFALGYNFIEIMRCISCGYQNVSHASKCIKCNESLLGADSIGEPKVQQGNAEVKKTVIGKAADAKDFIDQNNEVESTPSSSSGKNEPPKTENPAEVLRATINPWNQPRFETIEFVPLERDGQTKQPSVSFQSDQPTVILNRDNLDPDNPTITRKDQAELTFDSGQWQLKDRSSIGTFLKLSEAHTLKDGDQVLMGDRIFTIRLKK